jgi:hypothetical protein
MQVLEATQGVWFAGFEVAYAERLQGYKYHVVREPCAYSSPIVTEPIKIEVKGAHFDWEKRSFCVSLAADVEKGEFPQLKSKILPVERREIPMLFLENVAVNVVANLRWQLEEP